MSSYSAIKIGHINKTQCSQGFPEWKVVDFSRLLLSVSWLSSYFIALFALYGCLQLHCHSQKALPLLLPPPPAPPNFQYPMNSRHYDSRYRKYLLHFGSLFPFLLNHLATFCSWLNLSRIPTLQVHLETYSAHEAWQRHCYVRVVTLTQLDRRCVWRELYVYFKVIVRGESRKEYLGKRPYYAAIQKHAFPTPLGKDNLKHLLFLIYLYLCTKTA